MIYDLDLIKPQHDNIYNIDGSNNMYMYRLSATKHDIDNI